MTIRLSLGRWRWTALLAGAALPGAGAGAQSPATAVPPLTLPAALREGDQHAFALRRAAAGTALADARARGARAGILPQLRVEGGAIRTTDPIGAFGALLRQRRVSPAAFNPVTLNEPAPITTVQSALVTEVPLVNLDAWSGRKAAQAAAGASRDTEAWTRATYRLDVVRGYYGAVLASARVRVLEQARLAAAAGARQVDAMVREGVVTKADALQAAVHVSQVEAQLLGAQADAMNARDGLGLLLGRTNGAPLLLPDSLPSAAVVMALVAVDTAVTSAPEAATRADVRAARAGVRAADADAARALGTLLPRINGFARYDWFTNDWLFAGRKAWTVGVMASWSAFGGGRELADRQAALAGERAARTGAEAAEAQATQEIASARRAVVLAVRQLQLAELSAMQSREAFRLVDKRYLGGLATIAERLAADATATGAALAQTAAIQQVITAVATYRLTLGRDPAALDALTLEP